MTRILLVRHGHVEGIFPERFRGRRDVDLSALGARQAQVTALDIARTAQPSIVYTSPLRRCVQTGSAIGAACAVSTEVLADLNDLDYGDWEWRTYEEARAQWPALFERWLRAPHLVRFPNGDSLQDLVARVANVLRRVLEQHRGETVVVVGHSSGNRALLLQALEQPLSAYWCLEQDPCAVSEIEVFEHGTRVRRFNETHHLAQIAAADG
jgi:broad specificity phosphatase PhoE